MANQETNSTKPLLQRIHPEPKHEWMHLKDKTATKAENRK